MRGPFGTDVAAAFGRWTFSRAVCHRGYVLVSGLYFVIVAHLSAFELLVLGTVMSLTLVATDIPAGVWSDGFSRKWPLVIGHGLLAAGMVMTGLVTAFPLLVVTQVLWALGWAFSTGADVAWVTDEMDEPAAMARVLTRRARYELLGGAAGMVGFGLVGFVAGLGTAAVVSGAAMAGVGLLVAVGFAEDTVVAVEADRWRAAVTIFGRGLALSRGRRAIRLMLAATLIINAAAMAAWIFPRQLVDRGFPGDPVLWYGALGVTSYVVGALSVRLLEARIDGDGVPRRAYVWACVVGAVGVVVLAAAPAALVGGVGVLLVAGVGFTVTRAVSVVWVNERTTSDVRATMHSFLSQAESVGEIAGGLVLVAVARLFGIEAVLVVAAAGVAAAGCVLVRARPAPAKTRLSN